MGTLFVGLGVMGTPMARNYSRFSGSLYLFDLNSEHARALGHELGATALSTLSTLPEDIDIVILMLPNSGIVEGVLLGEEGLLSRLRPGAIVIDMSSSEPARTAQLADSAAESQIGFVDAPVSGGVVKANSAELTIMVGGNDAEHIEAVLPHLSAMGSSVQVVGKSGAGHAAKALNNLLGAVNLAAASEVLMVAKKFGIEPSVMLDVLNVSTGRNQATEFKFPTHILSRTFGSRFAMDLMIKDIHIAADLAASVKVGIPVGSSVINVSEAARGRLGEGADHTEIARYYELVNAAEIADRKETI